MFEWQRQSQDATDTPHFERLLKFLDLKAQAFESFVQGTEKHQVQPKPSVKLRSAYTTDVSSACNVCGAPKHPLFVCREFKSLPCEQRIDIMKQGETCFNYLKPGHFKQQCLSGKKCQKCGKAHHTLLHQHSGVNPRVSTSSSKSGEQGGFHSLAATNSPSTHRSHLSHPKVPSQSQCIFVMFRVMVTTPEGYKTQSRALLDSASSSSFITERLAQRLHLPRQHYHIEVAGIGGTTHGPSSHSFVSFNVPSMCPSPNKYRKSQWEVEAIMLPRITGNYLHHLLNMTKIGSTWQN